MRPTLAVIALCSAFCLLAFGQAFTPRRPFVYVAQSSGETPPDSASIFSWWVANDLPRSINVNAWTDRIAGIVLTQANASSQPFMKASNALAFTGGFSSGQVMSNHITWSGSVLNWTFAWMAMHTNYGHSAGDWILGTESSSVQLQYTLNGGFPGILDQVLGGGAGMMVSSWQDTTNGNISDFMVTYDDSALNFNAYTNGILCKVSHLGSHANNIGSGFAIGNFWQRTFNYYSGYVYEAAIWTNLLPSTSASNWHWLRTNKYGLTPTP